MALRRSGVPSSSQQQQQQQRRAESTSSSIYSSPADVALLGLTDARCDHHYHHHQHHHHYHHHLCIKDVSWQFEWDELRSSLSNISDHWAVWAHIKSSKFDITIFEFVFLSTILPCFFDPNIQVADASPAPPPPSVVRSLPCLEESTPRVPKS